MFRVFVDVSRKLGHRAATRLLLAICGGSASNRLVRRLADCCQLAADSCLRSVVPLHVWLMFPFVFFASFVTFVFPSRR